MNFSYTDRETDYLKSRCKRMAGVIESVGHINRKADDDLFSSVVHHIIGQQISTRAQQTIWQRMQEALGEVNDHFWHGGINTLVKTTADPDTVAGGPKMPNPNRAKRKCFCVSWTIFNCTQTESVRSSFIPTGSASVQSTFQSWCVRPQGNFPWNIFSKGSSLRRKPCSALQT